MGEIERIKMDLAVCGSLAGFALKKCKSSKTLRADCRVLLLPVKRLQILQTEKGAGKRTCLIAIK